MSVSVEYRGDVAILTMDDGKANAVNHEMLDALNAAFDEAEQNSGAIVLTGRPGKFCSGFDLKVMLGDDLDAVAKLAHRGGEMALRLFANPKPLIAACNGHGMAIGAIFLLACDTRFGIGGDYHLGLNETALGLVLPPFCTSLAMARIPTSEITESVIQGKVHGPETAKAAGFLDHLCQPEDMLEEAVAYATEMAKLPTKTYLGNKLAMRTETIAVMQEDLKTVRAITRHSI